MTSPALNDLLWEVSNLTHLPQEVRDHLTAQVSFVRSIAEKDSQALPEFEAVFGELIRRLHLLLRFNLEHQRMDTREVVDILLRELSALIVPSSTEKPSIVPYLTQVKEAFLRQENQTEEFFDRILPRYQLDLGKVKKRLSRAAQTPKSALRGPTHALSTFRRAAIVADFLEQIERGRDFLEEALTWFGRRSKEDFCSRWEWFRRLGRTYEWAKYFALGLEEDRPLTAVDKKPKSVLAKGNSLARFNQISRHFETPKWGNDAFLAKGDATVFYRYVRHLLQDPQAGEALPNFLYISEHGVGSGESAAAFLTHIAFLDLDHMAHDPRAPLVYPRLRYVCCVESEQEIETVQQNGELMKHGAMLSFHVIGNREQPERCGEPIFYARFRNFFGDFDRSPILYKDAHNRFYELQPQLHRFAQAIIRSPEYGQGDEHGFAEMISGKSEFDGTRFHSSVREALHLDYAIVPVNLGRYPLGAEIVEMTRGQRDILFPVSVGVAEYLDKLSSQLVPRYGYLQVFDFGFDRIRRLHHQRYYYAAQVERRYGFGMTHDLSFPLLGLVAKKRGCRSALFLQEDLMEKVTGKPVIDATPFVPHYSGRTLIRHVSVDEGIFHLSYLRFYTEIKGIAHQQKKKRTERDFLRFVAKLREEGYLGYGPKISYLESARDDLENLAFELDVWINGLFRALVGREDLSWLPLRIPLIEAALEEAGFDVARCLGELHRNPRYGALRVFRMRKQ